MKKCGRCEKEADENLNTHAILCGFSGLCPKCSKEVFPQWFSDSKVPSGTGPGYGIELEMNPSWETYIKALNAGSIVITEDGSLRGKSAEFVSPVLRESNFEQWVHDHFDGATATVYDRAGMHNWFETKHIGWHGLNALMVYLVNHERRFAEIVPVHRRPGKYAQSGSPMSMSKWEPIFYTEKCDFIRSLYGDAGYMLRSDPGEKKHQSLMAGHKRANDKGDETFKRGPICRYWWVNVHGHFRNGAIEVRLHQGTCDPNTIINVMKTWRIWIDFFSCKKNHRYDILDPLPFYLKKYWTSVIRICHNIDYGSLDRARDIK